MRLREPIDASKFDIRVLCTGPADSPDAGFVEGAPIDPPDESPGWLLMDLWVEHDTVQEKGEKGAVTTRKSNPAYYQLWARLKTEPPKKRGRPKGSTASPETTKKKGGRKKSEQQTLPNVSEEAPENTETSQPDAAE